MGTVSLTQISNGQTGDATVVDNNFDTLANEINGNLDATNLADEAVTTAKIDSSAVTFAKISAFDKCRITKASAQTIATGTETAVTFTTEDFDTNGMHDTGSNTSRITIQTAGKYLVTGQINWTANATGFREAILRVGGSTVIASDNRNNIGASFNTAIHVTAIYSFAAGDYVELVGYQNSGGDLDIVASRTHLEATLLP